ncbi:hypothetical protein HYPDE_32428 [Hyphomicrobium denitrificans 1NES1]|uniref:Uncharacterized protein n=1 Tax=Hyphomicrobium denitrificans 1NES1 TaxID=670307 RepID=N0B3S0_9HYPH|nr:hypothetical protein HYPDE_32428 [Hyphomicrobium denitrificans 1NES1]
MPSLAVVRDAGLKCVFKHALSMHVYVNTGATLRSHDQRRADRRPEDAAKTLSEGDTAGDI